MRRDRDVTRHNRFRSLSLALLLAGVLCWQPAYARAGTDPSPAAGALFGLGAGLCTLVYTPVKITYAVGGLVVSGLVYLWSAGDSSRTASLAKVVAGGDYVITPDHLTGDRRFHFTGQRRKRDDD
jgi:hypothetical protein